ncbi:MAG: ATP-binding protein [Deltaproteobacteria bacterium]|nr:ATP-binding protein [Deltaproteobacteria bacterium]
MLNNEIRELAAIGETEEIEFKVAKTATPSPIAGSFSFANGIGGKILVGVDGEYRIVGCDRDQLRAPDMS